MYTVRIVLIFFSETCRIHRPLYSVYFGIPNETLTKKRNQDVKTCQAATRTYFS